MNNNLISFALNHIVEGTRIFDELSQEIENFFEKYEIPEWLTQSQARRLSEILLSGKKEIIMLRLDEYRKLQLKRKSQKDKWQRDVGGEKAINAFYQMVDELPNTSITSIIINQFKSFDLAFDPESNNEFIFQSLIQKFNYLFIMKYSIQRKGGRQCLKN